MQQNQTHTFTLDTRYRVSRARSCTKLLPVYWNAEIHTAPEVKALHQSVLDTEYIIFGGGQLISANRQEEWEKVCETIARRMISDETYFVTLMTLEREAGIAYRTLSIRSVRREEKRNHNRINRANQTH